VEGTEPLEVLRATLAQLDVLAHDADDVSLLLDGVREIPRIGHAELVCDGSTESVNPSCYKLCISCANPHVSVSRTWKTGRSHDPWKESDEGATKSLSGRGKNRR